MKEKRCVGVLLPLPFQDVFDYAVPEGLSVTVGDYVCVPFGRSKVFGVVWGAAQGLVEPHKIKAIESVAAHLPAMTDSLRSLIDWVAWYTLSLRGLVLKMALSAPDALIAPAQEPGYRLLEPSPCKLTPARLRIQAYLADGSVRSLKQITQHAKVSAAVVKEFTAAGGLECVIDAASASQLSEALPAFTPKQLQLSPDQQVAAKTLLATLSKGFSVTLLDGVTGSGKTEVYFEVIEEALRQHKQVLILLPEIALSVQWLSRFEHHFGFAPMQWHSQISGAKKRDIWRQVALGGARVVVGARSALFLPFKQLGLLVVDEEHDASYKQEDKVIYQARDMSVVRAAREKIPVILVSATPSLETEYNVTQGRYGRVQLPNRHGDAELPTIRLIDMRQQELPRNTWLSTPMRDTLVATLASHHQAMLFMNRRGYAPLMLCRACGHRFQCAQCSSWLVLHRSQSRLVCHHCGTTAPVPKQCPDCKEDDTLLPFGPGVERIAEEVRALLPDARIGMMTSDHVTLNDETVPASELIHRMIAKEVDILIGTQMIAKGHHFAGLAMVGILDADMGLGGGDIRATERTYQLLHQLSGRAGRAHVKGDVWLQTYMPQHPVMQALIRGERDEFMQMESQLREDAAMPPYGKLAAVIIEGTSEQEVVKIARELVRVADTVSSQLIATGSAGALAQPRATPQLFGPAPAPLFLLRGKVRYRILIKASRDVSLQNWIADWLPRVKVPSAIRVKVDIDPYSFM